MLIWYLEARVACFYTTIASMAFEATTLLQLVPFITWNCLSDTPCNQKNVLFSRFFTSQAVFEELASTTSTQFAPGLFDILQAVAPPIIHLILFEKPGCRPRVYIGSLTSAIGGVQKRLRNYKRSSNTLPKYVKTTLDEGYAMIHRGLLCWSPFPTASSVPKLRLLFVALEAVFAYLFWELRTIKNNYGMNHICLWDRKTLQYDGLCSHCCLNRKVLGDFDLTAEELEEDAALRKENKYDYDTKYRFDQLENNVDEYRKRSNQSLAKYKSKDPEGRRQRDGKRYANHKANKT